LSVTESSAQSVPLVLAGVATCALYAVGVDIAPDRPATDAFLLIYLPLFAVYLFAAWWVWRRPGASAALIVVFAMVFRIGAALDPPQLSSDIYRYAWDGRVQRAGISPYAHPPESPALAGLADDVIHPQINRAHARTVYPPGAQLVLRALPYSIDAVRAAMIALDLIAMLLLVRLLRRREMDPARVVLYAWAPLVVYEIGNGGHLEAAVVPALVAAALAAHAARPRLAGVLIGVAAAVKLFPIAALAAFARERTVAVASSAVAIVAVGYAAYGWSAGTDVLGFLPEYVGVAEDHNIGLRRVFEWLLAPLVPRPRTPAFVLCVLLFVAGATWIWRSELTLERALLATFGLYLVVLPTAFHPWYAIVIVPWLCLHPRASWIWLTGALPFSYLKYGTVDGVMPGWVVPLEWGPTAALLAWEARRK